MAGAMVSIEAREALKIHLAPPAGRRSHSDHKLPVVPANALMYAHISKGNLICRPCARRDPYRVIFVVGKKAVPRLLPQTPACGYGSLRSQGRQRVCGPTRTSHARCRPYLAEFKFLGAYGCAVAGVDGRAGLCVWEAACRSGAA